MQESAVVLRMHELGTSWFYFYFLGSHIIKRHCISTWQVLAL